MKRAIRCIGISMLVCLASCQREGQRYVIIHADDAGMCESVNRATIKAMESGVVSSASIMVPCPAFEEFARYAAAHPEKDFGIHLVLNSEWDDYRWGPISAHERVPSLMDADGCLWKTGELVVAHVNTDEAEIELRAQIAHAKQFGIRISHLDSHMFSLFIRPDLLKLYLKLAVENDVPILLPRLPDQRQVERYQHLAVMHAEALHVLRDNGLPLVDFLESGSYGVLPNEKRDYYLRSLRNVKPGVTEIVIHCGMNDAELARITTSAARRYADFCVFTSKEIAEELKSLGIKVTNWRELRGISRASSELGKTKQHGGHEETRTSGP